MGSAVDRFISGAICGVGGGAISVGTVHRPGPVCDDIIRLNNISLDGLMRHTPATFLGGLPQQGGATTGVTTAGGGGGGRTGWGDISGVCQLII
jgi:hypothetical protein